MTHRRLLWHRLLAAQGEGAGERLRLVPRVLLVSAAYFLALVLYLMLRGPAPAADVDWVYVLVRVAAGVGAPLALGGVWRFFRPPGEIIYVYDWFGAALLCLSSAFLITGAGGVVGVGALRGWSRTLLAVSWTLWSLLGITLLVGGIAVLTTQLLSEQARRRRTETLIEFTRLVTSLDYQTILDQTVRRLHDLLESDACVLFLWDEGAQALVPRAGLHNPGVYSEEYISRMMSVNCLVDFSCTGRVFETGKPVVVTNDRPVKGCDLHDKSCLLVPIQVEGRRLGVLRLIRTGTVDFTQSDLDLVISFVNQAALVIEHGRIVKELSDLSTVDGLTGLFNARHFESVLAAEINRTGHSGSPVALLMVDSDSLKRMNDQFGHQKGNDYLRGIAGVIRGAIRLSDYAFRYAGDEFLVLLPGAGVEEAMQVGERIRKVVEERESLPGIAGTVSVGVAVFPLHAADGEGLLGAADRAMYESKRLGKNRVTAARAE